MFSNRKSISQRFRNFISTLKSTLGSRRTHRKPWLRHPYQRSSCGLNHPWNHVAPGERYSTVSDLCSQVGNQLPLSVVKLIARDVLRALDYVHQICGKSHGDINPETIMVSPSDMSSLISQLSEDGRNQILRPSQSSSRTLHMDFSTLLASPETAPVIFRLADVRTGIDGRISSCIENYALSAPEFLLDAPCDTRADMWGLGCVLYELLTGEALFDPFFQTVELGLTPEQSHFIQIIELFGDLPQDLLDSGKASGKWFDETGALRLDTTYYPVTLDAVLGMRLDEGDVALATSFLRTMLQLRPQDRLNARDILEHPWFSN